ncbi:hypothetical protein B0H11DRAFT_2238164 [Mycena galericulata]|nr:hypothetical protein B0H11DRAFT_2238164 [Mycena galericulata]
MVRRQAGVQGMASAVRSSAAEVVWMMRRDTLAWVCGAGEARERRWGAHIGGCRECVVFRAGSDVAVPRAVQWRDSRVHVRCGSTWAFGGVGGDGGSLALSARAYYRGGILNAAVLVCEASWHGDVYSYGATSHCRLLALHHAHVDPDHVALRAYAKTHTTTSGSVSPANAWASNCGSSSPSILAKALPLSLAKGGACKASHLSRSRPLSNSTQGAEVVPTLYGTGMRVLYAQPDAESGSAPSAPGGRMIPAGPRARLSR